MVCLRPEHQGQRIGQRIRRIGFFIECVADPAILHASIKMPTRRTPAEIFVRLRHPDDKKMKRVLVNGKDYHLFDKNLEIVILQNQQDTADIIAQF